MIVRKKGQAASLALFCIIADVIHEHGHAAAGDHAADVQNSPFL
jgi:hypothetical protein